MSPDDRPWFNLLMARPRWSRNDILSWLCDTDPNGPLPAQLTADWGRVKELVDEARRIGNLPVIVRDFDPFDFRDEDYSAHRVDVLKWAHSQADLFPMVKFPAAVEDPSPPSTLLERLPARALTAIRTVLEAPADSSQEQIADLLKTALKVSIRDAQAYAALFRPDAAASRDRRATRHREKE